MLTRSGVATCATAAASFAAGRVFGLPELFVVGAALVAAVVLAVAAVTRRRPVLTVTCKVLLGHDPIRRIVEMTNRIEVGEAHWPLFTMSTIVRQRGDVLSEHEVGTNLPATTCFIYQRDEILR